MGKIKFQGPIEKFLAKKFADKNRQDFKTLIGKNLGSIVSKIVVPASLDICCASYSSKNDFPEQILSILSFLKYVGTPASWTIYSDGSHEDAQMQLVQEHLPFARVVKTDFKASTYQLKAGLEPYRKELIHYASSDQPLGKKLLFYLNHNIQADTIFLDSDILFYAKAREISFLKINKRSWFLPEWIWGTLDQHYVDNNSRGVYQVNSGFIYLCKDLNCDSALEYLKKLNSNYSYFTEQTTIHILLTDNACFPLDPRIYFLNNSDQFDIGYNFNREDIAIRHFTGPVRHKMWQRDWKWQLSISN